MSTSPIAPDEATVRDAYRFRQSADTSASTAAAVPASERPRTRPRGRLLIAGLMVFACGAGVLTVWDSLLRYQAYGVVTGKIIDVSAPIDGVLQYVHVREGDDVRQDGRLATVHDLECEQRLARVADELRIAEASLHAEIAKIRWQSQVDETEMTRSIADFFNGSGQIHEASGLLGVMRNELYRTQALSDADAARELDLRNQTVQEQAQTEKLLSLQQALEVLKERAETVSAVPRLGSEQVAPLIAKVEMLLNETKRIQDWIAQGDLRAPVNGRVLFRHHPAGECIKSHEPLFSVMEESSLEIEMYLPQAMAADYEVGDTIDLKIEPFDQLVPCEVVRIGAEHRVPPENIQVFYRRNIRLLPVTVRPDSQFAEDRRMSVGAVARLPHFAGRRWN